MTEEVLQIVEVIPYRTFKEKLAITKEYDLKAKIQIEDKYVFIEKEEKQ